MSHSAEKFQRRQFGLQFTFVSVKIFGPAQDLNPGNLLHSTPQHAEKPALPIDLMASIYLLGVHLGAIGGKY